MLPVPGWTSQILFGEMLWSDEKHRWSCLAVIIKSMLEGVIVFLTKNTVQTVYTVGMLTGIYVPDFFLGVLI